MKSRTTLQILSFLFVTAVFSGKLSAAPVAGAVPKFNSLFYETAAGRTMLPDGMVAEAQKNGHCKTRMSDGRVVKVSVEREGKNLDLEFSAKPDANILKWGTALDAGADEYFTG